MLFSLGRTGWGRSCGSFSLGAAGFPVGLPGQMGFESLGVLCGQAVRSTPDTVPCSVNPQARSTCPGKGTRAVVQCRSEQGQMPSGTPSAVMPFPVTCGNSPSWKTECWVCVSPAVGRSKLESMIKAQVCL